jgi:hypothetical protein
MRNDPCICSHRRDSVLACDVCGGGGWMIVGAPAQAEGAVYVWGRQGDDWKPAQILPTDPPPDPLRAARDVIEGR